MFGIFKRLKWYRGAISFTSDCKEDIKNSTLRFIESFVKENNIKANDILLIIVIAPKNLSSAYPCTFIRKNNCNIQCITVSDIEVKNTPQNILRFLIQVKTNRKLKDLYLDGAKDLKEIIDKLTNE